MLVLTIISYFATTILPSLFDNTGSISSKFSSYESQLLACQIKPSSIDVRMRDVGGLDEIKKDIELGLILPLQHPKLFFAGNKCMAPSRGMLFVGAPGTGKTMLAKAIAKECNVQFLSLTLATLENKYFGESSKILAAAFSLARKIQPCILFFDEIDGMMKKRTSEDQACTYSFKTEFLTQMDGMSSNCSDAIVVIGSTNNSRVLDDALKRRLPKVYHIGLPAASERLAILNLCMRDEAPSHPRLVSPAHDWIAEATDKMSGSDLQEIYRAAASARLTSQLQYDEFREALSFGCIDDKLRAISDDEWRHAIQKMQTSRVVANSAYCEDKSDFKELLKKLVDPPS